MIYLFIYIIVSHVIFMSCTEFNNHREAEARISGSCGLYFVRH